MVRRKFPLRLPGKYASSVESVGEPRRLGQVSERVVEGDFGVLVRSKSIGSSSRNPRLIVESLDCAARECVSDTEPIQEEVAMVAERPRKLLERLDFGTHGHPCPFVQEASRPRG